MSYFYQAEIYSLPKILARLADFTGNDTDASLARALGVTPQAIANARKKDSIPYERLVKFAIENGISLDWLFTGKSGVDEHRFEKVDLDLMELVSSCLYHWLDNYNDDEIGGIFDALGGPGKFGWFYAAIYNRLIMLPEHTDRAEAAEYEVDHLLKIKLKNNNLARPFGNLRFQEEEYRWIKAYGLNVEAMGEIEERSLAKIRDNVKAQASREPRKETEEDQAKMTKSGKNKKEK